MSILISPVSNLLSRTTYRLDYNISLNQHIENSITSYNLQNLELKKVVEELLPKGSCQEVFIVRGGKII
ncbi:hypothetical protein [Staphylococcus massiliensis]|uniref:Uncharacterized protein n=1 Tax=Staphylococcus massiliensis S46 TaxID=1229783 RepID=K9B6S7_9STAP|nr:hypothetical protein [Staphylococcus massiliensis]EKU50542.1 hypothetical protein C273_00935 [Staphylococcus massiliensis S46]MCG3401248.1 hypothetical protein [Staphylococcus massiliensis]MCG3412575.1 hypothetical protein [Staphylococcus massiliensis]PNZ97797.1 hypothetical protein CD133_10115 [Staphylococcus massiliensis CCUG 55927]